MTRIIFDTVTLFMVICSQLICKSEKQRQRCAHGSLKLNIQILKFNIAGVEFMVFLVAFLIIIIENISIFCGINMKPYFGLSNWLKQAI